MIAVHFLVVSFLIRIAPAITMRPPAKESVITLVLSSEVKQGEIAPPSISASEIDKVLRTSPPSIQPLPSSVIASAMALTQAESGARQSASSPAPAIRSVMTDAEDPSETLLSRLRANWLPPPGATQRFRCKLRISYRQGGIVTSVSTASSCSDQQLANSVEKAVWKSQPLTMLSALKAGFVDLEFTP